MRHGCRDLRLTSTNSFMDQGAFRKASDRVRMAGKALRDLEVAKDFSNASDAWLSYLISWKGAFSMIEKGAKVGQDKQWFQAWKDEKNTTHLLKYLYEARNDGEHGFGEIVLDAPSQQAFGVAAPGYSSRMTINLVNGVFFGESHDGLPILNTVKPRRMVLLPVTDRNGREIAVPEDYRDTPLSPDNAPLRAAQDGYSFIQALLAAAKIRLI